MARFDGLPGTVHRLPAAKLTHAPGERHPAPFLRGTPEPSDTGAQVPQSPSNEADHSADAEQNQSARPAGPLALGGAPVEADLHERRRGARDSFTPLEVEQHGLRCIFAINLSSPGVLAVIAFRGSQ
uniref:Uncharacterized protein n=1 Tax=Anopheles dirus TaxID=7168 RepID=A0A182NGZ0_9DIPT